MTYCWPLDLPGIKARTRPFKERSLPMSNCELLETCGFFQKYQDTLDLACRGFLKTYCQGEKMDECARKKYRMKHGTPPADDMLPTGQTMPQQYR
jgi:hypothetical protein